MDVRITVPVLVTLAALVAIGCTQEDDPVADSGCAATVREASFATEVEQQIALLDVALVRCRSYETLLDEMRGYPGIVGYELATFVELRCTSTDDDAVRRAPACAAFVPSSTIVTLPPAELVFIGETLDGRPVELRPDNDTVFVGAYPEVVQRTVDIATEAGCVAVLEQRDLWAARAAEPDFGDEASAYANHAQNVALFIGCEFEVLTGPPGAP